MRKIFIDPNKINPSLVKQAAQAILEGSIVALPTETVYGLAARADREDVNARLYAIKKRPKDKPFSLALGEASKAINHYFDTLTPFGYRLIEKFWPGPLTIIYYSPQDKKVAIRVPSHIVTTEILKKLDIAVYLPSANISGQKEAVSASEVEHIFDGTIDLIVDSGTSLHSQPSTVLDLTTKPFKILREGVVSEEEIAKVFVRKRILFVCTGNSCRSPMAQFLLEKYLSQIEMYFNDRYEIISRGMSAVEGSAAAPAVVYLLKDKENLDIRGFSTQGLDRHTILSSDLIFTMEDKHTDYILRFEPKAEGKVFPLKKFLPPDLEQDIPDPIGQSDAVYQGVYSLIKEAILELRDWL